MSVQETIADTEKRMKAAIDAMTHDFSSLRTGRANPAVLERVHVEYYGSEVPINQIANISVPEPRQLLIQPYEKNMSPIIERAIMKSDIGINPVNDGTGIRLNFPQMTEDRRKEMVKSVHARAEQAAIAIRNVRRDAIEATDPGHTASRETACPLRTEHRKSGSRVRARRRRRTVLHGRNGVARHQYVPDAASKP